MRGESWKIWILLLLSIVNWQLATLHADQNWKLINIDDKHYFSISASGGYFTLLESIDEIKTKGGAAGLFGIGYEFRFRHFYLATGVDVQYGVSTLTMAPFDVHAQILDTQGKPVNYHYHIEGYTDRQKDFRFGIPLMLGFYTNSVYLGVGAKFAYAPQTISYPTITYQTYGSYEQYIEDFENMPNHFYTTYTTTGRNEVKMHPQGYVIAELGYDILNKERQSNYALCSVLKIALYAEYGLNSCMTGAKFDQQSYEVNETNPSLLNVDAYYACHDLSRKRVVPFYVGVKVSFLLRIRTANCQCEGPF